MEIKIDTLQTSRLVLRKYDNKDISDFIELKDDDTMYHFQPSSKKQTKKEYTQLLKDYVDGYDNANAPTMRWAIELKSEHKIIGEIGIQEALDSRKRGVLFWAIVPKYQKQGFAYEGVKAVINYLFANYDFHKMQVNIWDGNNASLNLAKKLGFVIEGKERESRFKDGKFFDNYILGLMRREWQELKIYK